jgi:hypothetical protein
MRRPFASSITKAHHQRCKTIPTTKHCFFTTTNCNERAKKRGEPFSEFAVIALAQIYHISDVPAHPDREANVQVTHDLLPLHTEDEIREKYDQLRERCRDWPARLLVKKAQP